MLNQSAPSSATGDRWSGLTGRLPCRRKHCSARREVSSRMKILVTGHLGYLGVEMTSFLVDLGHEVVGLDTDLFAECDFLAAPDPVPTLGIDLRDVTPADLLGFDAVIHLAALSNDPLCGSQPGAHLRHQSRCLHTAREGGKGRRRRPIRFLVVVQPVREGRRPRAGRAGHFQSGNSLRRVEGPGGASFVTACRRQLLAGVPAQRHSVRLLAPPKRRCHGQQPRRSRGDQRQGEDAE